MIKAAIVTLDAMFGMLVLAFNFLSACATLYAIDKLVSSNVTIINVFLVGLIIGIANLIVFLTYKKIIRNLFK